MRKNPVGRPPAPIKKLKVVVYLEPEVIAEVDKWAEVEENTRSTFISKILRRSIDRRAAKN